MSAGEITPAALPNIFAAKPPTFAMPLLTNPFAPVINFDPTLPNCGKSLVTNCAPLLIKPLTSLNAFFIFLITCVNIFFPIIFHTKNALTKLTKFYECFEFSAPLLTKNFTHYSLCTINKFITKVNKTRLNH